MKCSSPQRVPLFPQFVSSRRYVIGASARTALRRILLVYVQAAATGQVLVTVTGCAIFGCLPSIAAIQWTQLCFGLSYDHFGIRAGIWQHGVATQTGTLPHSAHICHYYNYQVK